jgi:hypothetical protein
LAWASIWLINAALIRKAVRGTFGTLGVLRQHKRLGVVDFF